MKLFCPAIKDSYITNKFVTNQEQALNSNVGKAGTLDLFKIYGEVSETSNEISRILIKFDLTEIKNLINDEIDINDSSFHASLKLFDVKSGHQAPENYSLMVLPLKKEFDEGHGIDIAGFENLDAVNFITSSFDGNNPIKWKIPGAFAVGPFADDVDLIENYEADGTAINTVSSFFVSNAHSNVNFDVTNAVSGVLAQDIPDFGFLIAFSGSYADDEKSRFIKRFASRHSANPQLRPRIEISYDDSIRDHHADFRFDISNDLYFKNNSRNGTSNFVDDINLNEVSGNNCMNLKLSIKDFEETYLVSQVVKGTNKIPVKGFYVAKNVVIPSFSPFSGSLSFNDFNKETQNFKIDEKLKSLDDARIYHSCCLNVNSNNSCNSITKNNLLINTVNLQNKYNQKEIQKIKVFIDDISKKMQSRRTTTLAKKSKLMDEVHYRLVDSINGSIIFDFDFDKKSTRMSYNEEGMFFNFNFNIVPFGRPHCFEFAVYDQDEIIIFRDQTNFSIY